MVGEHGKAIAHDLFVVLADEVAVKFLLSGPDFLDEFLVADGGSPGFKASFLF
jgi:hypothetical protein